MRVKIKHSVYCFLVFFQSSEGYSRLTVLHVVNRAMIGTEGAENHFRLGETQA